MLGNLSYFWRIHKVVFRPENSEPNITAWFFFKDLVLFFIYEGLLLRRQFHGNRGVYAIMFKGLIPSCHQSTIM